MALPTTPGDITVDWLNEVLADDATGGAVVTSVRDENIGEGTGIFGEIARLHLDLDDGGSTSIVAKMPCTEPANLEVALMLGIYDREIKMFSEVIPRSPMGAPTCHLAAQEGPGSFVLLMQDMGRDWEVGDQVVGATIPQAEAIVDVLADFHAHWWEHPELASMDWLPVPNAPQYVAAVPGIYRAGIPVLTSEWSDRVPAASIELALAVDPRFEQLIERTAAGPTTLIHTDTRLDNIFFAKDGSGDVAFIDFQLALRGRGVADIAYLVGTSVPQPAAAANWESLLRRWHDRLTTQGVDYSWDDALLGYKESALYYLSGAMSLIGTFDAGNERGAALVDAYSTRILNHVVDIDAGAVL